MPGSLFEQRCGPLCRRRHLHHTDGYRQLSAVTLCGYLCAAYGFEFPERRYHRHLHGDRHGDGAEHHNLYIYGDGGG